MKDHKINLSKKQKNLLYNLVKRGCVNKDIVFDKGNGFGYYLNIFVREMTGSFQNVYFDYETGLLTMSFSDFSCLISYLISYLDNVKKVKITTKNIKSILTENT